MSGSILWYVHDHGLGHLRRAMAVVPHLTSTAVIAAGPGVSAAVAEVFGGAAIALPSDVDLPVQPTVGPWHYAPHGDAMRARTLAIAEAVERYRCTTAVVDVSAEVTVLARLLGMRVITLRQSGRRDDPAHRIAFETADVVWVPQHRDLEPTGSERVDDRWQFSGAFSRYASSPVRVASGERRVVLMVGRGGHSLDVEAWTRAVSPLGWSVAIIGVEPFDFATESGIEFLGRVDDVEPLLRGADVVITSAGWASVADAVACTSRLVLIAEDRPFAEQSVRAERLRTLGLAVRLDRWPDPDELPAVLNRALALDVCEWHRYFDGNGAVRAAAIIERCHAS